MKKCKFEKGDLIVNNKGKNHIWLILDVVDYKNIHPYYRFLKINNGIIKNNPVVFAQYSFYIDDNFKLLNKKLYSKVIE